MRATRSLHGKKKAIDREGKERIEKGRKESATGFLISVTLARLRPVRTTRLTGKRRRKREKRDGRTIDGFPL